MNRFQAMLISGLLMLALIWGCSAEKITSPGDTDQQAVQAGPDASRDGVVTLEDLESGLGTGEKATGPDVAVTAFTATPVVVPGEVLSLQATVSNLGTSTAVGPFSVWIGVLGTNFEFVRVDIDRLVAGELRGGVVNFDVPVDKFAKAYPPGTYTLYCTHDFRDNNPTNNYLLADVELRANADPAGSIRISVLPAGLDAPWVLTGPDGALQPGNGDTLLTGLPVGDYTIDWGEVPEYQTPAPETRTLLQDQVLTFMGTYLAGMVPDYLTLYFDGGGGPDVPGEPCTTADFLDHVTAYIVYMNPTVGNTRGFEAGFDITTPAGATSIFSLVTVTYPIDAVDVGTSDPLAGTYNYITGYAAPLEITGSSFVFATLDIFVLDAGELDFTLRGSIPWSPPNNLPKVMLGDFSLLPLELGMAEGSPTMVLNPTGDCPVIPVQ